MEKKLDKILSDIKDIFKGEIRLDKISRVLYSTSACMYRIMPKGVLIPKDEEDVINIIKYAYKNKIPITARGAGSSLAGQALGEGIILDFSKYMNKIIEINEKESYVRVQPGIVQANLNKKLFEMGNFFPPDPSSNNWCTIGGMIANNASGLHSIKYGSTRDYVISLKVVLFNGEVITTKPIKLESDELNRIIDSNTLESKIYSNLRKLYEKNVNLIEENYPKVLKNSCGYYLKDIIKDNNMDITKLFTGSEGTLGIIIEAKLKIIKKPRLKATVIAYFADLEFAGKAITEISKFEPSAGELMCNHLVNLVRQNFPEIDKIFPKSTDTVLLIEFDGNNMDLIKNKIEEMKKSLKDLKLPLRMDVAYDPHEQEKLWQVRRSATPIINSGRGNKKFLQIAEDTTVHPSKLVSYIKDLYTVFSNYNVTPITYGHAFDGNIHVRIPINIKYKDDFNKILKINDQIYELVLKYQGTFSGEHGDGRLRSAYVKKLYPTIYPLFERVKGLFDPLAILNPKVKISSDKYNSIKDLRYNLNDTTFSICTGLRRNEYRTEIEACHGCSQCKSTINTNMCPIYKVLQDERATPKSKANLAYAVISGKLNLNNMQSEEFMKVFDYCLTCGLCSIECPSYVNIPKIVLETRFEIYKNFGQQISKYIVSNAPSILKLGSLFSSLANITFNLRMFRYFLHQSFGIDKRRTLPKFQKDELKNWYRDINKVSTKKVVYFAGCFTRWFSPEIGRATVNVLAKCGVKVIVPDQKCCGIPMLNYGNFDLARKYMAFNIKELNEYVEKGYDIITSCPSCSLSLKHDYLEFFRNKNVRLISKHTFDVGEYLTMLKNKGKLDINFKKVYLSKIYTYHAPCHLKVQRIGTPTWNLVKEIPYLKYKELMDDKCCGMGGTFGLFQKNYEISMKIGSKIFNQINKMNPNIILTDCPTCKMQIVQITNTPVLHPIQILDIFYK